MSSRSIRQFLACLKSAGIRYLPHVDPPPKPTAGPSMTRGAARKAAPPTAARSPTSPRATPLP
ncbi:MAG: hypothetical protein ABJZ55_07120, partial [Fuerstiella sp.]